MKAAYRIATATHAAVCVCVEGQKSSLGSFHTTYKLPEQLCSAIVSGKHKNHSDFPPF